MKLTSSAMHVENDSQVVYPPINWLSLIMVELLWPPYIRSPPFELLQGDGQKKVAACPTHEEYIGNFLSKEDHNIYIFASCNITRRHHVVNEPGICYIITALSRCNFLLILLCLEYNFLSTSLILEFF